MMSFYTRWVLPRLSRKMFWRVGGGVLACFFFLQIAAIFFHAGNGVMRPMSFFVLPPAWVRFSSVSYHRVVETAHAFTALGIASTYQDAFPLALAFVVRDARIQDMLGEYEVSQEEIFTENDRTALARAGISFQEQKKYIEGPLLRIRAAEVLRDEMLPSQDMRLQNVLEKIDLGMPFVDIARYFSEDSSAMNGGDLGVFLLSELPPWAQDVATLEAGEVRSGFVGTDAFWVLKVTEAGGEGGEAWVHLRGIAINKPTLGAILDAHAEKYHVWVFVW